MRDYLLNVRYFSVYQEMNLDFDTVLIGYTLLINVVFGLFDDYIGQFLPNKKNP